MLNLALRHFHQKSYHTPTEKVLTNEPTVIAHPSTKTKSNNLNGNEISIGESIIIPNDINMEEITISITRKGKKNSMKNKVDLYIISYNSSSFIGFQKTLLKLII